LEAVRLCSPDSFDSPAESGAGPTGVFFHTGPLPSAPSRHFVSQQPTSWLHYHLHPPRLDPARSPLKNLEPNGRSPCGFPIALTNRLAPRAGAVVVPILKHCHAPRTRPNRIYRAPARNGGPASAMLAPSLLLAACWLGAGSVSAALQTFNLTLTAGWAAPGIRLCVDDG
jgi:hypothetical protein